MDAVGLLWGESVHEVPLGAVGASTSNGVSGDASSSDDDDDGDDSGRPTSKRARRAAEKADEKRLRALERKRAKGAAADAPQSAEDFDRMIMAEPNNSYIWVQYMAFYLQVRGDGRLELWGENCERLLAIADIGCDCFVLLCRLAQWSKLERWLGVR